MTAISITGDKDSQLLRSWRKNVLHKRNMVRIVRLWPRCVSAAAAVLGVPEIVLLATALWIGIGCRYVLAGLQSIG